MKACLSAYPGFIVAMFLVFTVPARAYTVGTAFTEPCHERITSSSFEDFAERGQFFVPDIGDGPTGRVGRHFLDLYGYDTMSPRAEAILFALIMGVRDPDSQGVSPTDLSGSRYLHANRNGQSQHALRRAQDDGPEGNAQAVAATRADLEGTLQEAQDWFARPPTEQVIDVDYFLESYGRVRIQVWAPAFFIGRALHTLQDSFSHALRSQDMRRLVHIFNYIEAIGGRHDLARDGLRHSSEMDRCYEGGASSSLFLAAREASTQLVGLVLGGASGGRLGDASAALDRWLTFEPGCTLDNDYCGNPFVVTAQMGPTAPVGTCTTATSASSPPAGWVFLLLLLFAWRRPSRHALVAMTLAVTATACKPTPLLIEDFEPTAPCGGDPTGAWYFSATSEAVPRNDPREECPLLRDEERYLYSGRIQFEADGTLVPGVTVRHHLIQVRDASCDPACNSDDRCVTRDDVCHCLDVRVDDWLPGGAGAPVQWATQGDTLELRDEGGAAVLATGYCVDEGEDMEWASVRSPSIGQRLQRIPE